MSHNTEPKGTNGWYDLLSSQPDINRHSKVTVQKQGCEFFLSDASKYLIYIYSLADLKKYRHE